MRNLLYKELNLSIHPFFYILPILVGLLIFIPMWIYLIVFMYFFWFSMVNIPAGYIAKEDNSFNAMLPVAKKEIVQSKIYAIIILQGIHIIFAIIFGIIHNYIYGTYNFFFDINIAFFGIAILMFAVFNISFFPWYFKTAYSYGKPVILGVVITLVYGFVFEFDVVRFEFMRTIFEGTFLNQMIVLVVAIVVSVVLTIFTMKLSVQNFERIK